MSATMNLLFCTAPPGVYTFLTYKAYPATFAPFLPIVPDVPNNTECTNNNERATVKATHAINKKTRVDIITMNTALAVVFFKAQSSQVRASFLQRCLYKPNIVFVGMFVWCFDHYGKMMAEDREANRQHMAADWHPTNGFDTLVLCLFTGTAFAGCTNYTMANPDIVDIGLRLIKWCSMYANEHKAWIARKAIRPIIVETFDSFKSLWAARSPWSTRPPSPPVHMGTEWPPPPTTTPSSHIGKPS